MEHVELTLARILFKYRVYRADGQAYEDLFVEIMELSNSNFEPIKPQGSFGDRKNDGYDRKTGQYYQVYAPEDPEMKIQDAINKLTKDFDGLMKNWNTITPVQEYHFVFNDKYKGAYPTIHESLNEIKEKHNLRDCSLFRNKHLAEVLFSLSDDQIQSVVGLLPNTAKIDLIDFSVLSEILQHIMESPAIFGKNSNLVVPDFEEKIVFNNLAPDVGNLLTTAGYQVGNIDKFFELNDSFAKSQLRDQLNELYQESLGKGFDDNNLVFYDILDSIMPKKTKSVQDAALVVMAYFFESCDIFEEPKSSENSIIKAEEKDNVTT